MKESVVGDLAKVLTHNYFGSNPDPRTSDQSTIIEILMGLRSAAVHKQIEVVMDHSGVEFKDLRGATTISLKFEHEDFPKKENRKDVVNFVRKILEEVFY